jgi:hypothetical protein
MWNQSLVDTERVGYIDMEYYSATKRKNMLIFATKQEELEDIECKPYADQHQMFPMEKLEVHPSADVCLLDVERIRRG